MSKTQILFLSASPEEEDQTSFVESYKQIRKKIKTAKNRDQFELEREHRLSVREIQDYLTHDYQPQIVHFFGHGEKGSLLFENEEGEIEEARLKPFVNMFRILNNRSGIAKEEKIRLVVLVACDSYRIAKAVSKHVDCAIGMSSKLSQDAGMVFAESFYSSLCSGFSVLDSFELACLSIEYEGLEEQKKPKIIPNKDCDPKKFFFVLKRDQVPQIQADRPVEKKAIKKSKTHVEYLEQKSFLLPDIRKITDLKIDNGFLDKLYEQALKMAKDIYDDSQLSGFYIYVSPKPIFPYPKVTITMTFYSKWADKICNFDYNDVYGKIVHSPPNKSPELDYEKEISSVPPWKTSPTWMKVLKKIYARIQPLTLVPSTYYDIWCDSESGLWTITFFDGVSGEYYQYEWDGEGLGEKNIHQILEKQDEQVEEKEVIDELLPDKTKITKLDIDNSYLDNIYKQALSMAENIYSDPKLNRFSLSVYPFLSPSYLAITLSFYSKWANKLCQFHYDSTEKEVIHQPPDRRARRYDKEIFKVPPWESNPDWMQALNRIYSKIGVLPHSERTSYHVHTLPFMKNKWEFGFHDGYSGEYHRYEWDGEGLGEKNIHQILEEQDEQVEEKEVIDELLPDETKITELKISQYFLDELYEKALNKARFIYDDAQFSKFKISVFSIALPGARVKISFSFSSYATNRVLDFEYENYHDYRYENLFLRPEIKPAILPILDVEKREITDLPWRTNPQWREILDKIYSKIVMNKSSNLSYTITKYGYSETWRFYFWDSDPDAHARKEYEFEWDGKQRIKPINTDEKS